MQIVIEITDRMYEAIKQDHVPIDIGRFIRNGTSLPKGHGRLIDESNLKNAFIKLSMVVQGSFTDSDIAGIVYNSPTIIEADKESEE